MKLLTEKERVYLGNIMQKQRRSKRLTMATVAKEANMSQDSIVKIERGGNAKQGNYFRYGKYLNLQILKLLVKYRKMNDLDYGQETRVKFPYSIGVKKYELMGYMTEMPGYKNLVIVTLGKNLDYDIFSKDFPQIEKVAVARRKTTKIPEKRNKFEKFK